MEGLLTGPGGESRGGLSAKFVAMELRKFRRSSVILVVNEGRLARISLGQLSLTILSLPALLLFYRTVLHRRLWPFGSLVDAFHLHFMKSKSLSKRPNTNTSRTGRSGGGR